MNFHLSLVGIYISLFIQPIPELINAKIDQYVNVISKLVCLTITEGRIKYVIFCIEPYFSYNNSI